MKKYFKILAFIIIFNSIVACSSPGAGSKSNLKDVELNEKISVENLLTYSVNRLEIVSTLEPPNVNSFYTYYEPNDKNNLFLDLVLNVTNNSNSSIEPNELITATFKIDGKEYK